MVRRKWTGEFFQVMVELGQLPVGYITSLSTNLVTLSLSDSARMRVSLSLSLSYYPMAGRFNVMSSIRFRYSLEIQARDMDSTMYWGIIGGMRKT